MLVGLLMPLYSLMVWEDAWSKLIESSIMYEPTNSSITGHLPVLCCIQRDFTHSLGEKKQKKVIAIGLFRKSTKKSSSHQMEKSGTHVHFTLPN